MVNNNIPFHNRHIGPRDSDISSMLAELGLDSLEQLIEAALPKDISLGRELDLPAPLSEAQALAELKEIMSQNKCHKSFIGQGYNASFIPPVIARNMLENPAWYSSYTPYQAEISQGRLELLFHFQTLISELTGLKIASASLLDQATALAEAQGMAFRFFKEKRRDIIIASQIYPQDLAVLQTRGRAIGLNIYQSNNQSEALAKISEQSAAVIIAWPDHLGSLYDYRDLIAKAKEVNSLVIVIVDPLALTILEPPGSFGADIVIGSLQRFGTPLGFGGPHAGFLAAQEALTRLMPGRIVGQSLDSQGNVAYRLALQTREQHIRRDKATSNICTAQALLANMSTAYAIWHGPQALKDIAYACHYKAQLLAKLLRQSGYEIIRERFFDNITIKAPGAARALVDKAHELGFLLRFIDEDHLAIAFDETSSWDDFAIFAKIFDFAPADCQLAPADFAQQEAYFKEQFGPFARKSSFLTQKIFNKISSETEMMRYLRLLADKDLALDRAMIPLGSCTMKMNAASELMALSWPEVANIHPMAPMSDSAGYHQMIKQLESWLCEITGFAAISFQSNSGAQGEYAGLLAIKRYHESRGEGERNICLIPSSAHGTNPASAHMAGMKVVVIACRENGDIDIADLQRKAEQYKDKLAALMVTYPSTHGVYEEGIKEICAIIHQYGGQVYFDGANLNALVGLARPFDLGADVCHLNLHKTFAIPHGGGGPGAGPIGVASHLTQFMPGHHFYYQGQHIPLSEQAAANAQAHAIASAPFSSASILTISWMYIRMMGAYGLKKASQVAILNANYIAHKLSQSYPIVYKGAKGYIAHECIIDTRFLKDDYGISVDDIAKRLIDYGFHAPTMSFPVAGTLMIEPTESENKAELDRFCRALLAIKAEADEVKKGNWSLEDNPLVNAPHNLQQVVSDEWPYSYSRKVAAFPDEQMDPTAKYWPPVARIDNVFGDRNLICSCPPLRNSDD